MFQQYQLPNNQVIELQSTPEEKGFIDYLQELVHVYFNYSLLNYDRELRDPTQFRGFESYGTPKMSELEYLQMWKEQTFQKVRPLNKKSIVSKIIETMTNYAEDECIDIKTVDSIFLTGGGLNL